MMAAAGAADHYAKTPAAAMHPRLGRLPIGRSRVRIPNSGRVARPRGHACEVPIAPQKHSRSLQMGRENLKDTENTKKRSASPLPQLREHLMNGKLALQHGHLGAHGALLAQSSRSMKLRRFSPSSAGALSRLLYLAGSTACVSASSRAFLSLAKLAKPGEFASRSRTGVRPPWISSSRRCTPRR